MGRKKQTKEKREERDKIAVFRREAVRVLGFTPPEGRKDVAPYYETMVDFVAYTLKKLAEEGPYTPTEEEEDIISEITRAFKGVTCRNEQNVLLCGQAADDYAPQEVIDYLAQKEEREDWTRLHPALLRGFYSSLYFLGPEALRFLAPACMCTLLRSEPGWMLGDAIFYILTEDAQNRSLFTPEQLHATARFFAWRNSAGYFGDEEFAPWKAILVSCL